jgi:phosphate transport system substrate-binding protein
MKKYSKLPVLFILFVVLCFACNIRQNARKPFLRWSYCFVDETLTPIIEDQVDVLKMNMKLKLINGDWNSKFTIQKKAAIAILSRNLTAEELSIFKQGNPSHSVLQQMQ